MLNYPVKGFVNFCSTLCENSITFSTPFILYTHFSTHYSSFKFLLIVNMLSHCFNLHFCEQQWSWASCIYIFVLLKTFHLEIISKLQTQKQYKGSMHTLFTRFILLYHLLSPCMFTWVFTCVVYVCSCMHVDIIFCWPIWRLHIL